MVYTVIIINDYNYTVVYGEYARQIMCKANKLKWKMFPNFVIALFSSGLVNLLFKPDVVMFYKVLDWVVLP